MTNIDTALAAVAATYAEHSRLVASGTASDIDLRRSFVATLRADHALHTAYGEAEAAQAIAYEIEWTIGDAARAGMVIS